MSYVLNSIGPAAIALAMIDSRTPTPESDSLKTTLIFKQPVNDKFNNTQAYLIIIITYYSQSGNSNQLNERNELTMKHVNTHFLFQVVACSLLVVCLVSCTMYQCMYHRVSTCMYCLLVFLLVLLFLYCTDYRLILITEY